MPKHERSEYMKGVLFAEEQKEIGWDKEWLTKPHHEWFYCGHVYYDGDHWGLRIGKFYVGVSY